MDATTLEALKSKLRRLVPESIAEAIAELKKALPDFSSKYNPLVLLESRLNDANLKNIQNLLGEAELQIEYNQIRADLLLLIDALEERDFQMILGGGAAKTGSLLYKIPEQMQLQKETKCLVRLAFEQAAIIRNIELSKDVTIKQVRVAEVMQVELIDPSAEHPFEIRSISDEEQFLEKGDYTEWVFYVKPLLEGTFPLLLKVTVVEVVQGKERLRNLTWEEIIQITATAPAITTAADFKSTGIVTGDSAEEKEPVPQIPAAAPAVVMPDLPAQSIEEISAPAAFSPPEPQRSPEIQVLPKKNRSVRLWMPIAATVLLVVTIAIFLFPKRSYYKIDENIPTGPSLLDSTKNYYKIDKNAPTGPLLLDSTPILPFDSLSQDSLRFNEY